ncbi:hypothetical protein SDC9_87470 [bioreactor metagenome]|uniref:Uncharacterized protein n=1 Tax=bioreactor metagenome TaxID=1076179 RepID=A0A644ZIW9_9ZZZZ
MKELLYILVFGVSLFLTSCNDSDYDDCDYQDCMSVYPTTGSLTIKVNFDMLNTSVPIRIYAGHYDDGELIREDTMYDEKKDYVFTPGIYYSVAAKYKTESGEITVVDGDKIEIITHTDCDSTCYTVEDAKVNCKLHY